MFSHENRSNFREITFAINIIDICKLSLIDAKVAKWQNNHTLTMRSSSLVPTSWLLIVSFEIKHV